MRTDYPGCSSSLVLARDVAKGESLLMMEICQAMSDQRSLENYEITLLGQVSYSLLASIIRLDQCAEQLLLIDPRAGLCACGLIRLVFIIHRLSKTLVCNFAIASENAEAAFQRPVVSSRSGQAVIRYPLYSSFMSSSICSDEAMMGGF